MRMPWSAWFPRIHGISTVRGVAVDFQTLFSHREGLSEKVPPIFDYRYVARKFTYSGPENGFVECVDDTSGVFLPSSHPHANAKFKMIRYASPRTLRGRSEKSKRVVRSVPSSKICPSDVWPVCMLPNYLQIVSTWFFNIRPYQVIVHCSIKFYVFFENHTKRTCFVYA